MNAHSAQSPFALSPLAEGALAQVANAPQPNAAPPPAAGQPAAPGAPAAADGNQGTTATTQQQPPAPAPSGGGASSMLQLALPILIIVGFYFLLIRPQQKKARELDSKLKKGDKVYTSSGIIGRIANLGDKRVTLEIAKDVKIEVLRSAIGGLDEGDVDPKQKAIDKAEKAAADAKK